MQLSGKDKRRLRSQGQHLAPALQIGKAGLNEATMSALDRLFEGLELVKVRLPSEPKSVRNEMAEAMAQDTGAALVGTVGRNVLLFRSAGQQAHTPPVNNDRSADPAP
jgi:RNA-binding protein